MSAAARNLELKAIDPDPERTLRAALALGAEDRGTLRQRDTYFHAVQGRLKLREAPPAVAELIAYARADRPEPVVSSYRVVPVYDPDTLGAALAEVLGVKAVVVKQRRLLQWRSVRVHLDAVSRLGTFVELEAVPGAGGLEAEKLRVQELRRALDIADERLVARGYADLLGPAGVVRR